MAASESKPERDFDEFSKVTDQLSEEEKEGHIGKLVNYIKSTMKSGYSIYSLYDGIAAVTKMKSHIVKVETLLDNLIKTSHSKEDIIKEAQEFHSKNCTGVMENFDFGPHIELIPLDSGGDVSEVERIKLQILSAIKDQQRQACDGLVTKMAKVNGVAAALQCVKLYMAWKTISAASNVIEDKNKFTQINKNLQKFENIVKTFVELCETQPEDKRIHRKMTEINALFTTTLGKISDVTLNINGHIQRLDVTSDYAAVDVISNGMNAIGQGIQLWNVFDNLSSPAKWLGGMGVAMYTVFGLANAAVIKISQDKLKELRKDLKDALYLRDTLDDLRQQAVDALTDM